MAPTDKLQCACGAEVQPEPKPVPMSLYRDGWYVACEQCGRRQRHRYITPEGAAAAWTASEDVELPEGQIRMPFGGGQR